MVKTNCSTFLMVYNIQQSATVPRRAAMIRHTDCHAGQQQQPGLAQREGIGCHRQTAPRYCQHPISWALCQSTETETSVIQQICRMT